MGPGRKLMSAEERQAMRDAMRDMTPEQRQEFRAQHHKLMMERAGAEGMDMPPMPKMPEPPAMGEMPKMPEPPAMGEMPKMPEPPAMGEMPDMPPMPKMPEPPPMPERPDMKQVFETVAGMSDEEREACRIMYQTFAPPMEPPRMPTAPQGYGYGPGYGQGPGYGRGQGWGYGPNPYGGEQGRGFAITPGYPTW